MVPDDVVDVFILILHDSLRNFLGQFKRVTTITRPMPLALSKRLDSTTGVGKLLATVLDEYSTMEVVFMPIILNKHYHLVVLEKEKRKYRH